MNLRQMHKVFRSASRQRRDVVERAQQARERLARRQRRYDRECFGSYAPYRNDAEVEGDCLYEGREC